MSTHTQPIHVVAGVIRDARGRILLARRTKGRDLAGLWEFPGGKREPGETAQQGLVRELQEELGIEANVGVRLINVPQQYPHKRIHLDVYQVDTFRGHPKGLDGQALVWAPPHKLPSYPMPPGDIPVVAALLQPTHYWITPAPADASEASARAWLDALQMALQHGAQRVLLRAPGLAQGVWQDCVSQAVGACAQAGAEVLVSGDARLAERHDIGLHLRAAQLAQGASVGAKRPALLAASCHNATELAQAQQLGCNFAVLGPVAATATHPEATPMGWSGFAALREAVSLPIYALGGMQPDDVDNARAHGAQGIAAIRGLWPNEAATARESSR